MRGLTAMLRKENVRYALTSPAFPGPLSIAPANNPGGRPVARHPYPPLDNLPERLTKEIRNRVAPDRGNVWKMLMWTPDTAPSFIDFSEAVRHHTLLSPKLRELIILRVGELCGAAYEVHHHKRIAREVGMTESQIAATRAGADTAGLDEQEKLVLAIADDLVKDKQVGEANFAKAVEVFGVRTVADIVLLAGFYTTACYFLKTFGIDIEQPSGAAKQS
jgi:AhpD family alkylhydroperoxidase